MRKSMIRAWLPICVPFAALCCALAMGLFLALVERSVIRDAERSSMAWAEYAAGHLTRVEALAQGADVTDRDSRLIADLAKFGDVFRFKLFGSDGRLQFVSEDAAGDIPELESFNEKAALVAETGRPLTAVADGRAKAERPDLYSETYLPVAKDGRVVAVVEVYLDRTEAAAAIRADYATFGLAILALSAVGIGGPAVALVALVRTLRGKNRHLDAERRRAEAADRAKTEFLANVTHELRTPLNGVLGIAELLEAQDLDEEGREMLELLRASAAGQAALVDELLDITKIESGDLRLRAEPFDPEAALRDVVSMMRPLAAAKGLALRLEADPSAGRLVVGDGGAFGRVCTNLIGNAVKFTRRGAVEVVLELHEAPGGSAIRLAVTDTGPGIAEADQSRIFERFVQVDGSLSRAGEGTGLGLAISRALVELMGGAIRVDSAPGRGATFEVMLTLPAAEAAQERMAA
jgi:signal transduction histidine kinase